MIKKKSLEEAVEFLTGRGLSVTFGDVTGTYTDGYEPDAEGIDAHNRLVAIIVDDSKDGNAERVRILKECVALDNRIMFILIPSKKYSIHDPAPAKKYYRTPKPYRNRED